MSERQIKAELKRAKRKARNIVVSWSHWPEMRAARIARRTPVVYEDGDNQRSNQC